MSASNKFLVFAVVLLVAVIVAIATFGVKWELAIGVAVVLFVIALWTLIGRTKLAVGQCTESRGIREHAAGLMESSDHIFPKRMINCYLSANSTIMS